MDNAREIRKFQNLGTEGATDATSMRRNNTWPSGAKTNTALKLMKSLFVIIIGHRGRRPISDKNIHRH
jgi:hypothetical protein